MIYIGIDVGKNGGCAVIDSENKTVEVFPWDDEKFVETMREMYMYKESSVAVVEKVGAMPKQGVTSMFNFGKSAGFIEGVLSAYNIPYQLVPPHVWKKEFHLGKDKQDSINVCKRLFPKINLLRTEKCRKEHDGMAEALLMAEYARRHM